jgi:hypothetical protein|tara:strand:- start:25668 stop:25784 length:117 start_codon:yes stop_codon:yes gene_type:complete
MRAVAAAGFAFKFNNSPFLLGASTLGVDATPMEGIEHD